MITYTFNATEHTGTLTLIHPTFDLSEAQAPFAFEQLEAHERGLIKEDWILFEYDKSIHSKK